MFCRTKRVKYSFIKEHKSSYKIQELCRILKVPASSYYKWTSKKKSSKELMRDQLLADVQKIYQASNCRYGAPKIHA
ncbi:MAG: transposase [Wolbachia pipientis]